MGRGLDVDWQETEISRQRLVSGDQPNKGKRDLCSCGLDCLKQQEEPGVAQIRNAAPKTGACGHEPVCRAQDVENAKVRNHERRPNPTLLPRHPFLLFTCPFSHVHQPSFLH